MTSPPCQTIPARLLLWLVGGYRRYLSPLSGPTCKYHPTCSAYSMIAIREHGAARGARLAIWRLLRCNPWSHGGVDDVPGTEPPILDQPDESLRDQL